MADVEKVKRQVRALLEKTVERGCTEAEATAAAVTAARLMSDHGLSDDDLVMAKDSAPGTRRQTPLDTLWGCLARVTGCALVRETAWDGARFVYYGREPGPTIAVYLHTYLLRTVESVVEAYQASPEYKRKKKGKPRRKACEAFRDGMARRLAMMLEERFGRPRREDIEKAKAFRDSQCGHLETEKPRQFGGRQDAARWAGARAEETVEIRDGLTGGATGYLEG